METQTEEDAELSPEVAEATVRLLKAIKERMISRGESIDEEKLRHDGCSEAIIAHLREV